MIPLEKVPGAAPWTTPYLEALPGFTSFVQEWAGARCEGGLYRFHDTRSGPIATEAVATAFPEYRGQIDLFGQDWLGRQFGFDHDRQIDGSPAVLLWEFSTASALALPHDFDGFHIAYEQVRGPALAGDLFDRWRAAHPESLPLASDRCIGFRQPLFLGGEESVDNLEESDLDVYLTLTAQIWDQVRDLPDGATVDGFGTG